MSKRIGPYLITYTGKKLYILDCRPQDIDILDLAHALSQIPRYGGHLEKPFYVSQHSIIVHDNVPKICKPYALVHDGPEYCLGDVVSPLKDILGEAYRSHERRIMDVIIKRYNIPFDEEIKRIVKIADKRCLYTEMRDLRGYISKNKEYPPYDFKIKPWTAKRSEKEFLKKFNSLGLCTKS